jgi:hypothetical protein
MSMPPELRALMQRYCQLGQLLPHVDDLEDVHVQAGAEVVIIEMARVKSQIDDFLAAARARKN